MPVQAYLVDTFTTHAASALAANSIARSIVGGLLPLAGQQMYTNLGLGWGNSLLAFIALVLTPVPWVFFRKGEYLRERFAVVWFLNPARNRKKISAYVGYCSSQSADSASASSYFLFVLTKSFKPALENNRINTYSNHWLRYIVLEEVQTSDIFERAFRKKKKKLHPLKRENKILMSQTFTYVRWWF